MHEVPDGEDADGNQQYRTEHYEIHWTFTNGTVPLKVTMVTVNGSKASD